MSDQLNNEHSHPDAPRLFNTLRLLAEGRELAYLVRPLVNKHYRAELLISNAETGEILHTHWTDTEAHAAMLIVDIINARKLVHRLFTAKRAQQAPEKLADLPQDSLSD